MKLNFTWDYAKGNELIYPGKSVSELLQGFLDSPLADLELEFDVVEYVKNFRQNWLSLETPDGFSIVISASQDCLWLTHLQYEIEEQFEFKDWLGLSAAYKEARHV
jgi:hypothetical protein